MSETQSLKSLLQESDKKSRAKIELLEKKVRAKDQLFEDALASTVASSYACGSSITPGQAPPENKNLTGELKRRFLRLRSKHKEAEAEI